MQNNSINRYGNPDATQGYFGGKSHSHLRHNLGVNKYENGKRKLFLCQEFQKSLAVATMLREYNVVFFYKKVLHVVGFQENCASNGTNKVIQKKVRTCKTKVVIVTG